MTQKMTPQVQELSAVELEQVAGASTFDYHRYLRAASVNRAITPPR